MSDYGEHIADLAGYGVGSGELSDYDGYEQPEAVEDNATNETREAMHQIPVSNASTTADPKPEINRDHVEQHRAEEQMSEWLDSIQRDAHDDFFEGGREELKRLEE